MYFLMGFVDGGSLTGSAVDGVSLMGSAVGVCCWGLLLGSAVGFR